MSKPATSATQTNGSILSRDSEVKRCKVCCFVGASEGQPHPDARRPVKTKTRHLLRLQLDPQAVACGPAWRGRRNEAAGRAARAALGSGRGLGVRDLNSGLGRARSRLSTPRGAIDGHLYVLPGDRDELTIGYPTLDEWDLFADMRSLVAAHRKYGTWN